MDIPPGKRDIYAEILQILAHRSGQINMVSVQTLCDNYFPGIEDAFILACLRELHAGEYPVVLDADEVVYLTDKKEAERLIVDIRQEVFFE